MINQAVILAGGLGTRLKKVVKDVPKPMAPVGGNPFLEYLIKLLKEAGINNILLLVGYKSSIIKEYFGDGSKFGVHISYSEEKELLGTGGAIMNAWDKLEEEFLVLNGDTFFDIEYDLLQEYIEENSSEALIVLRYTKDMSRYGFVEVDDSYRVRKFIEKGDLPTDRVDGYINGGIYYFKKKVLKEYCESFEDRFVSIEKDVFPRLLQRERLYGLPMGGKFIDIGIPKDYRRAQMEIPKWVEVDRKPALFLDRDGVIIEDTNYPHGTDVKFIESAFDLVRKANEEGKYVIVVTNQAGVAKGKFDKEEVKRTNEYIRRIYSNKGLRIDAFYYCPYHIEGIVPEYKKISLARKPEPGMMLQACENFRIKIKESVMVGDKESDKIKLWGLRFVSTSVKNA